MDLILHYKTLSETKTTIEELTKKEKSDVYHLAHLHGKLEHYTNFLNGKMVFSKLVAHLAGETKRRGGTTKLFDETKQEYTKNKLKRWEIVEKLKQLAKYKKEMHIYMYSLEGVKMEPELRETMSKEFMFIDEWVEKNKDLKLNGEVKEILILSNLHLIKD